MNLHPILSGWDGVVEVWAIIPPHPSYSVSTCGRVRRDAPIYGGQGSVRPAGHVLTARPLPLGHLQVTLSENNEPRTVLVHRLVADAFLAPPEEGQDCVCHRDDDPAHNCPKNLFWGSRGDNSADKVRKDRQAKGERIGSAKLDEEQVREIRRRLAAGEGQYDLAASFGVTQSNISMIAQRSTWRHVL